MSYFLGAQCFARKRKGKPTGCRPSIFCDKKSDGRLELTVAGFELKADRLLGLLLVPSVQGDLVSLLGDLGRAAEAASVQSAAQWLPRRTHRALLAVLGGVRRTKSRGFRAGTALEIRAHGNDLFPAVRGFLEFFLRGYISILIQSQNKS